MGKLNYANVFSQALWRLAAPLPPVLFRQVLLRRMQGEMERDALAKSDIGKIPHLQSSALEGFHRWECPAASEGGPGGLDVMEECFSKVYGLSIFFLLTY